MMMKSADVSNPTKSTHLYTPWISNITEEFFAQGDLEAKNGLEISPFCNRATSNTPNFNSQKSFIEYIVAPLFEALELVTPLYEIMSGLEISRIRFCSEPDKSQAGGSNTELKDVNCVAKCSNTLATPKSSTHLAPGNSLFAPTATKSHRRKSSFAREFRSTA